MEYNEIFKNFPYYSSIHVKQDTDNKYFTDCKTTDLSKSLFDDLFLESHRPLALKSIQALYSTKSFIINDKSLFAIDNYVDTLYFRRQITSELAFNEDLEVKQIFLMLENKFHFYSIGKILDSERFEIERIYLTFKT